MASGSQSSCTYRVIILIIALCYVIAKIIDIISATALHKCEGDNISIAIPKYYIYSSQTSSRM